MPEQNCHLESVVYGTSQVDEMAKLETPKSRLEGHLINKEMIS